MTAKPPILREPGIRLLELTLVKRSSSKITSADSTIKSYIVKTQKGLANYIVVNENTTHSKIVKLNLTMLTQNYNVCKASKGPIESDVRSNLIPQDSRCITRITTRKPIVDDRSNENCFTPELMQNLCLND